MIFMEGRGICPLTQQSFPISHILISKLFGLAAPESKDTKNYNASSQ